MVTLHQLTNKKTTRMEKKTKLKAPAFNLAPHRKGIIYKITTCHLENQILRDELLQNFV